jgi:hypothetical protein
MKSLLKLCIPNEYYTTLCDKVGQWLTTGWWFSPISSNNKTDRHDITEILLKVALNTIILNPMNMIYRQNICYIWTGYFIDVTDFLSFM